MPKNPQGRPPWLHLIDAPNRAWREKQIAMGRDPDPYMEQQLKKAGVWPPKALKSKKLPRKLPEDPVSRAVHIMRTATKQEVGDTADKITRAPKAKKKR